MASSNVRSSPIHLLISAFTVLSLLPTTSAQVLLQYGDGQLPSCAQGCTLLNQAQSACVPPAAPATNQATYQSCFCQSAYLRTLYQSPNGVCDANCGQSDLVKIQQWYTGLCKSGAPAATQSSSSTSAPATSSTSAVATVSPTPTFAPTQQNVNKSWCVIVFCQRFLLAFPLSLLVSHFKPSHPPGSSIVYPDLTSVSHFRISTHYQWIIFLIVLILAIAFFSFGGVWLKRRLKRRAATRRATFNSTVTTATMPGSRAAGTADGAAGDVPPMRSMDWAKPSNPSSSRVGTPMGLAGGMQSVESGVGSTGSGSGSSRNAKGKAQATTAVAEEGRYAGDEEAGRTV